MKRKVPHKEYLSKTKSYYTIDALPGDVWIEEEDDDYVYVCTISEDRWTCPWEQWADLLHHCERTLGMEEGFKRQEFDSADEYEDAVQKVYTVYTKKRPKKEDKKKVGYSCYLWTFKLKRIGKKE